MQDAFGGVPIGAPPSHLSDDDEAIKALRGHVPSTVWRDAYPTTIVFVSRPALPEAGSWGLFGAANHAAAISEVVPDEDASYIQSGSVGTVQEDMSLPNVNNLPLNATGFVIIRVRESGGPALNLVVAVAFLPPGGGANIRVWNLGGGLSGGPITGSYATFRLSLLPAEYATIRASGGVTLRVLNTSSAGGVFNVTQAYLAAEI